MKRPSAHVVLHKHLSYGRLRGTFGILVLISPYSKTQRGAISVQSSMTPTYFCNNLPTLSYVQQEFYLRQSEFHMNTYNLHSLSHDPDTIVGKENDFLAVQDSSIGDLVSH